MKKMFKTEVEVVLAPIADIKKIVMQIDAHGGRTLLVGGAVRDILLNLPVKDVDIEVHGLSIEQLEQVLKMFGPVNLVGKSFGVLRPYIKHDGQGFEVDWSVPRADEPGRKPKVKLDPHMDIKNAFARRDLTINAMGIDLMTYELLDPFDGQRDLCNKVLRAPDVQLFTEDPLRFYRVMQFVARFAMQPDGELNTLCEKMDVGDVSRERIEKEFEKMFLKSKRPSLGLRWLNDIGRLDLFPELQAIVDVLQNPDWHPEGNVFEHTMQTIDAAAALTYETDKDKLIVIYAAMCHDLGKVTTTATVDGVIKSLRHESEGVKPTKTLLKRITRNRDLIDAVVKLVKYHMVPAQLIKPEVKASAYKRLANKLAPVTIVLLAQLCLADKLGRNPNSSQPLTGSNEEIDQFLARADQAQVSQQAEQPVLQGRDLIDLVEPGPKMGQLLKQAYQIQIDQDITDKDELKKMVLQKSE